MNPYHRYALPIGLGLALIPVHNLQLTRLFTLPSGETVLFLPQVGIVLVIIACGFLLLRVWEQEYRIDWGERYVVVPLLVIVGAIGLSGIAAPDFEGKIAPLCAGLALFAVYLSARVLGHAITVPLAVGAAVAALGIVVHAIVVPGRVTGGFVFELDFPYSNYDAGVGYVLLGTFLYSGRWKLPLVALALVAVFLSGSPEGVFGTSAIGTVTLLRRPRNWRRLLTITAPTIIVAAIWFAVGYGQQLYSYTGNVIADKATVIAPITDNAPPPLVPAPPQVEMSAAPPSPSPAHDTPSYSAIGYRMTVIKRAMTQVRPLGDGYSITVFNTGTVHNVPLIIVQQLGWAGVLAALAWLWVSWRGLRGTRWSLAWVAVLALSVFDHYVWTQMAPLWWVLVGLSTARSRQ